MCAQAERQRLAGAAAAGARGGAARGVGRCLVGDLGRWGGGGDSLLLPPLLLLPLLLLLITSVQDVERHRYLVTWQESSPASLAIWVLLATD